jgi:hypothetical protein
MEDHHADVGRTVPRVEITVLGVELGVSGGEGAGSGLKPTITGVGELGVRDLAEALVAARRWRNAVPELSNYHVRRLAALQGALGADADPDVVLSDRAGRGSIRYLFDATVTMLAEARSPFAGFVAGPREVVELYQRHGRVINAAGDALNERLTDLLVDLIAEIYQIPPGVTTTDERLRQIGFDPAQPEPDPLDYW